MILIPELSRPVSPRLLAVRAEPLHWYIVSSGLLTEKGIAFEKGMSLIFVVKGLFYDLMTLG